MATTYAIRAGITITDDGRLEPFFESATGAPLPLEVLEMVAAMVAGVTAHERAKLSAKQGFLLALTEMQAQAASKANIFVPDTAIDLPKGFGGR